MSNSSNNNCIPELDIEKSKENGSSPQSSSNANPLPEDMDTSNASLPEYNAEFDDIKFAPDTSVHPARPTLICRDVRPQFRKQTAPSVIQPSN